MGRRTSLSADRQGNIESRHVQGHASVRCKLLVSACESCEKSPFVRAGVWKPLLRSRVVGIGSKMCFNWLSRHVHPQSSVELGRTVALHERTELRNGGGEHCSLDLVGLMGQSLIPSVCSHPTLYIGVNPLKGNTSSLKFSSLDLARFP